ncbi:MAG: DoxX family protein [Rhizobiales bacterium]|nr:DoxX family protein [Hyphomicrobiales bacterium]
MSTTITMPRSGSTSTPLALYQRAIALAERIPLSLVQLAGRIAVGYVFWNSAQSKLASWPITIQLFKMEYRVPVLPAEIAATLATATELTGAILLFLGLFTRLSALALLGLVAVIQLFVYPGHWGEHLLWASLLLLLLARGAGVVSLDYLAKRLFTRTM